MPYEVPSQSAGGATPGVSVGNGATLQPSWLPLLEWSDDLDNPAWGGSDAVAGANSVEEWTPQSGSARTWVVTQLPSPAIGRFGQQSPLIPAGGVVASVYLIPSLAPVISNSCALLVEFSSGVSHRLEVNSSTGEIVSNTGIGSGEVRTYVADGVTYIKLIIRVPGISVPPGDNVQFWIEPDTVIGSTNDVVIAYPVLVQAVQTGFPANDPSDFAESDPQFILTTTTLAPSIGGRISNSISGQLNETQTFQYDFAGAITAFTVYPQDLARVIKLNGDGSGSNFNLSLVADLPNGFYCYLDVSGIDTSTGDTLTLLAGAYNYLDYSTLPPSTVGGTIIYDASTNTDVTLFKLQVADGDVRIFKYAGVSGGGGGAIPQYVVPVGNGTGIFDGNQYLQVDYDAFSLTFSPGEQASGQAVSALSAAGTNSNNNAAAFVIEGGSSSGNGNAGQAQLRGGLTSAAGVAGDATVAGGDATGAANGGNATVLGGTSVANAGGLASLVGGQGETLGGDAGLYGGAGVGVGANGGNINIDTGVGGAGGVAGNVRIYVGAVLYLEITPSGEFLFGGTPGVAGEYLQSQGPGLPPIWAP